MFYKKYSGKKRKENRAKTGQLVKIVYPQLTPKDSKTTPRTFALAFWITEG